MEYDIHKLRDGSQDNKIKWVCSYVSGKYGFVSKARRILPPTQAILVKEERNSVRAFWPIGDKTQKIIHLTDVTGTIPLSVFDDENECRLAWKSMVEAVIMEGDAQVEQWSKKRAKIILEHMKDAANNE